LTINLGCATLIPNSKTLPESLIIEAHNNLNKEKKREQKINKFREIKEIKTKKIEQVTNEELLMSYVGYFLSRGKAIITPYQGKITFEGQVYQYNGYDYNFVNFWHKLTQKRDFPEFYLAGDTHNFAEFLTGNYTVNSCSRCDLPIPIPVGGALDIPSCNLCEDRQIKREYKIIIFGEKVSNYREKLLRVNGFKCYIFSDPDSLANEYLKLEIDLILIDAEISPNLVKNWEQKLRQNEQLKDVPILALTTQASQVLPWQEQKLGIMDYILTPLNGEYLAEHLRKIGQLESSLAKNKLHWFPK
jgi:CheY-like chemotaxis protein